jgi:hypothetical protein
VFCSCQKPESTIGNELLPQSDGFNIYQVDTFQIKATQIRERHIPTDELSLSLVGYLEDQDCGSTQAIVNTQFRLSALSPEFPTNAIIDSVVLSLAYQSDYYGYPNSQRFIVQELKDPLYKDSIYFSDTSWPVYSDNLVADENVNLSIAPEQYVVIGGDTSVPQIRIPLDNEFGEHLIHPNNLDVLNTQANFQEYFYGLSIRSLARNDAIIRYDLVDPGTKLSVYYRDLDLGDTLSYDFVITSDCARYTEFKHNYSSSALNFTTNGDSADAGEFLIIQGGGGLKGMISFPTILNLNKNDKRVIAKAELILPFEEDKNAIPFDYLYLRYLDDEDELHVLPDETVQAIGGNLTLSPSQYSFNITRYLQKLLNNEIENQGIQVIGGTTGVSVKKSKLHGPEYSYSNSNQNARLVVTFATN